MNISLASMMKHFAFNSKTHQQSQSEAANTTLISVIELTHKSTFIQLSGFIHMQIGPGNINADQLSWEKVEGAWEGETMISVNTSTTSSTLHHHPQTIS